jgi:uncharacterized protein (DUF2236 family)
MDPVAAVRSQLATSVRRLVAGEPGGVARLDMNRSDPGWFGPGSATWQIHADAAMLVGGVRALLLQSLHPLVMAGVAEHSAYREDPLGRLHRTAQFIGTTTYGTSEQAAQAVQVVRAIHSRVVGVAPNGQHYSAEDPHLLAWVHVTEVDSFLRAVDRYGTHRVPTATADAYVAEMVTVGERLGGADLPRSTAELAAAIRAYRPELRAGRQSREALWFLANPPLPLAARPIYGVLFAAAVGLLPGWARRQLWLPRFPLTEAVAVRSAATVLVKTLGWALREPQAG